MFERFTDTARRVVNEAQKAAAENGDEVITLNHMKIGLRRAQMIGETADMSGVPKLRFSDRSKKALEFSLRDALSRGDTYIDAQHIAAGIERAKK